MEKDISNGNRNDLYWKNKLEDVSNLPVEILADKNATWEKLHDRLHQKRVHIKTGWYWAAAACFLFVAIIPVIINNRNQHIIVKNNVQKIQSKKETIPAMLSSKENAVVDSSAAINEKKTIQLSAQVNQKKSSAKYIAINEEPLHPALTDLADRIKEHVISPAATDSNSVNTFAVPQVKKKLKVVHINELGDSFAETSNIALQYEQNFLSLKLINHQSYTSTSLPSGSTVFAIFKTTKASSN